MNRYDSYKDSGVDWLGEVPSHWECMPIRAIFGFRNEKNDPIKTDNILSLSIANGVTEYSEENRGGNKRKDDLSSYKLAYPNDIVMNSMNVIVGAVGISKYFGAISPVYYALYLKDTSNTNLSYYDKIFKNENFQRGLLKFGKGILIKFSENGKMNTIRMKISQDDLKTLYFPIPPLSEQTTIAQYLDDKTAKIDRAIALEQQQIELLKERKQIVIQTAVTRGLNPDVAFKDSGVEWLGEVPEHWEVKKLKYVLELSNKKEESQNSDKRYIGMENVESFTGKINEIILTAEGISNSFFENEILFGKLRPYLAKSYLAEFDGICSTEFLVYKANKEIYNRFALNIFLSYGFIDTVNSSTYGSKMPRANSEFIANMLLAIPPLSEQTAIAQYLDEQTAKIDHAISIKLAQIDKLKEYKTVLINEVVTGKRRVVQN